MNELMINLVHKLYRYWLNPTPYIIQLLTQAITSGFKPFNLLQLISTMLQKI